jgi:hypothetical protein
MIFRRWTQDKDEPEREPNPEDNSKFHQGDHDEVEEGWTIKLPWWRLAGACTIAKGVLSRDRSCTQRRHGSIGPCNREKK